MTEFLWPVRVYYEDTDAGGVVFYANYLKFMERARTEYLRQFGFEQDSLIEQHGVMFAVHRAEIDYLRPAKFNELLQVSAVIAAQKKVSLVFEQQVRRENGEVCSQAKIKIVCVNSQTFKPQSIPDEILKAIANEQ